MDYEAGGYGLGDTSQGLLYQAWRFRYHEGAIKVAPWPSGTETTLLTVSGVTRISGAFDQNMRPAVAYVADGVTALWWYDSAAGAMVTTTFADCTSPRLALDDKRTGQSAVSDVLFCYLRAGWLRYRQQRDRYAVEYDLVQAAAFHSILGRVGLSSKLRMQFELLTPADAPDPGTGEPGDAGTALTGMSRITEFQPWDLERINGNTRTIAGALNALLGEGYFTWPGDEVAAGWVAGTGADFEGGITASAIYVNDANGRLAPVLLPLPAGLLQLGLVMQLPALGPAAWTSGSTGDLWMVLRELQLAMVAAGWAVFVEFPEQVAE